jgi:hypothetical protein
MNKLVKSGSQHASAVGEKNATTAPADGGGQGSCCVSCDPEIKRVPARLSSHTHARWRAKATQPPFRESRSTRIKPIRTTICIVVVYILRGTIRPRP